MAMPRADGVPAPMQRARAGCIPSSAASRARTHPARTRILVHPRQPLRAARHAHSAPPDLRALALALLAVVPRPRLPRRYALAHHGCGADRVRFKSDGHVDMKWCADGCWKPRGVGGGRADVGGGRRGDSLSLSLSLSLSPTSARRHPPCSSSRARLPSPPSSPRPRDEACGVVPRAVPFVVFWVSPVRRLPRRRTSGLLPRHVAPRTRRVTNQSRSNHPRGFIEFGRAAVGGARSSAPSA